MQGCVGGSCVPAAVFPTPAVCAGGGPPVILNPGGAPLCTGNIAQTSFTWGVCSCKNVLFDDDAFVDGWDSSKGPYMPGQLGGGVGANVTITSMSLADIWGQSWAASKATSFNTSQYDVHHDLQSAGDITTDTTTVTRNAYVVGSVTGEMSVGQTFYQTPGKGHPDNLTPKKLAIEVKPPCDCSSPIPVGAFVDWVKTNNDNAAIGLDPAIMTKAGHPARIDLPCGKYYLLGFNGGGSEIVAHGNTAIFIDGGVTVGSDLVMTIADSNSVLDIFVSGTIVTNANFKLGSPNYPALTRLYIGGKQDLDIQSQLTVGGEIWAGNAKVLWESTSDLFGALFAGDFEVSSKFRLHHDQGITSAGDGCPPPPVTGGTSSASAATGASAASGMTTTGSAGTGGGVGCGTCKDCGNQACINGTCGECTTDGQCCPPLVCTGGSCQPVLK
jgi:hypothetical protein